MGEYEDQMNELNKQMRGIEDATDAVEMLLDEDCSKMELGNCFMALSNEDTEEYLQERGKEIKKEMKGLSKNLEETIGKMKTLRAKLKKKFGDHIGLPEIKPNSNLNK